MDNITIPIDLINKHDLTINEYLVLYDIANKYPISRLIQPVVPALLSLQKKGFIKMVDNTIFLRSKADDIFSSKLDYFTEWLNAYPTRVKKKHGGQRALSPNGSNTILGKRLKAKWKTIFKKDIEAQEQALLVLQLEVKDRERNGNLEFMVEASRWLNEGFHEKNSFYLEDDSPEQQEYDNEDYM